MIWTIYDPKTGRIVGTVQGQVPPEPPKGYALLAGVEGDGAKERVTSRGIEPLQMIELSASTLTPTAGAAVSVTVAPEVYVRFDGDHLGRLPAGGGTLRFDTVGIYIVSFIPVDPGLAGGLETQRTFAVGAAVGPEEPADVVVEEEREPMLADVRARLAQIRDSIDAAEVRELEAEAARTAPFTTIAEGRAVTRELARLLRASENARAAELRHVLRAFRALVQVATRR